MKTWITLTFTLLCLSTWTLKAQTCYVPDTKIYHWKASQNTLPRFVAACIKKEGATKKTTAHRGFIIMLGKTNKGIYTVEGGQASDAVENESGFANFAFTPFNGQREVFSLYKNQAMDQLDEQLILKKLWRLHNQGVYKVEQLTPVTTEINAQTNVREPLLASKINWTLKVTNQPEKVRLLWHLQTTSSMCWCTYQWKTRKEAL